MFKKILAITFAIMFLSSVLSVGSMMTPASAMKPNHHNSHFPNIVGNVTDNIGPDGFGINEKTNTIYALGTTFSSDFTSANSTVSIIDGNTDKITKVIPFDSTVLQNVVFSEKPDTIYLLNTTQDFTSSSFMAMDAKTDKITRVIPLSSPGFADDVVFDHNTNKFFLPAWHGPVLVIDAKTLNVIDTIPGDNSYLVAINEKTDRVYVTNIYDATVSVIDAKTDQIIDTILEGIPASPDGCYVTDTCTVQGSHAHGVSVNENTNTIYVTNENGLFVTIDGNTDQVINSVQLVNNELYDGVVDEKTNTVYQTDPYQGTVLVIDGKTNNIVDIIPMGSLPLPYGCLDHGDTCVNGTDNTFSSPQAIAINHMTDKVYVGVDDNVFSGSPNGDIVVLDANTHQTIDKMHMGHHHDK